ncbi:jasmonate ZIM domain-containing protein 1-like isoform X1 [Primulina tabacum]|uniref:jasmonate ZIM domain-containing protein 1-like isoform X1 n=1 Tax=Primulina tabacum TaxID=48773 RepID=UPI003F59C6AB
MSGLQQFSDGRRPGKAPERSSFMHTCNLLSRYIKKKGSLRDFNLEIDGKIESLESIMKSGSAHAASASSTVNLLTNMDKPARPSTDSLPRPARPDCSVNLLEDTPEKYTKSKDAKKIEPETAQLTIFYGGRILVFDSCPADKAKELVKFASKGSPRISGGLVSNILHQNPSPSALVATKPFSRDGLPPVPSFQTTAGLMSSNSCKDKTRSEVIGHQKAGGISSNTSKDLPNTGSGDMGLSSGTVVCISPQPVINGSDLPIARRSSVHRFLEKRKERASARGPYQDQEHAASSSSKGDELLDLKL